MLEVAQSILSGAPAAESAVTDEHGRVPFKNPALARLDNFNSTMPQDIATRDKFERLALDVGLDKVMRWKPRLVSAMRDLS